MEVKQTMRRRLEAALAPFKVLAAAWAGGVMLGSKCDDDAYQLLVSQVAQNGSTPDYNLEAPIFEMISRGLGCEVVPFQWNELTELLNSQVVAAALPYDLTFPEVFYPEANTSDRKGFHIVLGNPPWDAILFKTKEFLAAFDFEILNAPTKRERDRIEQSILADAAKKVRFEHYKESFEQLKRANDVLFKFQKVHIDGDLAGRQLDAFRVFMERGYQLLQHGGLIGVLVPSAFHSNEGAAGVRSLYLREMHLGCCFSFENKRKLFEIHSSFKFATVVASKGGRTDEFHSAFYLRTDEWLFASQRIPEVLSYSLEFIEKTGGEHLAFVELRSPEDLRVCRRLFLQSESFRSVLANAGIHFQKQPVALDMTKESHRFVLTKDFASDLGDVREPEARNNLIQRGALYLSEGKTFHQFNELWGESPRYCTPLVKLEGNPLWVESSRYYRLAFRAIASSTNERTAIFCLLSPGTVSGNSVAVERNPEKIARSKALILEAFCNTFPFDWALRVMTSANVNLFIMNNAPVLMPEDLNSFLAHSALRLTCIHEGYAKLWSEQLGEVWRELESSTRWPAIPCEERRWSLRAALDATVAHVYGLTREDYVRVLDGFSHASFQRAPDICLAAFDEFDLLGAEVFRRKYDPYWEIPLNDHRPSAVIEYPLPPAEATSQGTLGLTLENPVSQTQVHGTKRIRASSLSDGELEGVRRLLSERHRIAGSDVQTALGLNAVRTQVLLKKLVEDGFAVVEGSGRATRYVARPGVGHGDTIE